MATISQLELAWNSMLDRFEAVLGRRLRGYFERTTRELKRQMENNGEVGGAIFLQTANQELEAIFNEVLPQVARAGSSFALNDLQPEKKEENEQVNNAVMAALALWLLQNSKEKAALINKTTVKFFITVTEEFRQVGLVGDELISSVTRELRRRNKKRSAVISATESHNAASEGQIKTGIILQERMQKTWISQRDRRVRHTHVSADGQMQDLNQPFRVGGTLMQRPGDPNGGASETIGCRCFLRLKKVV